MQRLKQLVAPVVSRYRLQAGLEAAQATNAWPRVARTVLGASFPVPPAICLKDGVLWLELSSSVVAQEVQLSKPQLLEGLQDQQVKDIRFRMAQSRPEDDTMGRRG